MAGARRAAWLIVAIAFLAPVLWEIAAGLGLQAAGLVHSEVAVFVEVKVGFALLLALTLTIAGMWRGCGFAGGLPLRSLTLLWPIWLAATGAVVQGFAAIGPAAILGWLAVAVAVGFGEEGIFRGVIIWALGTDRPRRAALVSAALFGLIHLVGLLSPQIDWRMILAQAVAAFGLGLTLAGTRLIARSIWPGILAHTALDFVGLLAAGSITSAMTYSVSDIVFMLVAAAVSTGWGVVLLRRL